MWKLTTSQVDKLQERWGDKPCNHNKGYGHEIDDVLGCDCFCVIYGMRYINPDFFIQRMKKESTK